MAYATAKFVDTDRIPVIDISALRDGGDAIPVARALHAASQNLGFIYVSGHGIPEETIEAARDVAYEFFQRSESEKQTVAVSSRHGGWLAAVVRRCRTMPPPI